MPLNGSHSHRSQQYVSSLLSWGSSISTIGMPHKRNLTRINIFFCCCQIECKNSLGISSLDGGFFERLKLMLDRYYLEIEHCSRNRNCNPYGTKWADEQLRETRLKKHINSFQKDWTSSPFPGNKRTKYFVAQVPGIFQEKQSDAHPRDWVRVPSATGA